MKSEFATDVFAIPKDKSFASFINQIYQTFDGKDCYPTLEEKSGNAFIFDYKKSFIF